MISRASAWRGFAGAAISSALLLSPVRRGCRLGQAGIPGDDRGGDRFGRLAHRRPPHMARSGTAGQGAGSRSEEHTSELQSLMRISYAVFCLKKKKQTTH